MFILVVGCCVFLILLSILENILEFLDVMNFGSDWDLINVGIIILDSFFLILSMKVW